MDKPILYSVKAQRGRKPRCKGWKQATLLRMLENTMIADGSEEADLRLEACMTTDSGIGVIRHAQAGYEMARQVAEGKGPLTTESIKVPLWWSPKGTVGPEGEQRSHHGRCESSGTPFALPLSTDNKGRETERR